MSETHEKRARAQSKRMKRKDKAEKKKIRREQQTVAPAPDVVEADYFFEADREPS
jgi:hypothetical protein